MSNPRFWRPFAPEYVQDPYPMYRFLREHDPVHQAQTGEFIITRYDHVREVLKSPLFLTGNRLEWLKRGIQYFEHKQEDFSAIYDAMNSFILMLNPPQHTRIRTFVSKAWDNREVDLIIRKNVDILLTQLPSGEVDIVADYAQPLPVLTIAQILGLSPTDCGYLKNLGIAMTKALDLYVTLKDLVQINDAAKKFISFFAEQIQYKSDHPDEGLISKLISRNRSENIGLSTPELISICIFLFIAGEETSSGLISTGLSTLLKHPAQLNLLRQQPEYIESAVEEVLRYDPTVQLLGRIAAQDFQLGGKLIRKGSTVTLVIGSANRDEKIFSDPDQFDITRTPNRHLSFGTGTHFCLGDWLARRQSQLAIEAFLKRFPDLSLLPQESPYYKNLAIRSLKSVKVRMTNDEVQIQN